MVGADKNFAQVGSHMFSVYLHSNRKNKYFIRWYIF